MIPRNNSHFAMNPSIAFKRSSFRRNHEHKLTMNVGDVVPIYWDFVLPGDTHKLKTNDVMRLSTLIAPIMDNIKVEMMYYFVPMRLVWSHTKEFFGENTSGPWAQQIEYQIPQCTSPEGGWKVGTIADYMGIPTYVDNLSVNALPFRAVAKVYDDWWRDENLQDPFNIPVDDNVTSGSNGSTYINDVVKGGMPFKAAKYFDVFTSALPSPQKGASVPLPITNVNLNAAPVYGNGQSLAMAYTDDTSALQLGNIRANSSYDVTFSNNAEIGVGTAKNLRVATKANLGTGSAGLEADLSGLNIGIGTINELRTAFQIQKYLERDARGGTRYNEILLSHFGIISPDARLQRSEYLGGSMLNLNINQVVQNSESGTTPQGNTAAYSLTSSSHYDFTKSFTEHGYIIGLAVARYNHSYQQGLARDWSVKTKYDIYDPLFANLGEFGIKNKEIYAQGSDVLNPETGVAYDEEIFGYNEAWYWYRYKQSYISGEFRSNSVDSDGQSNTLDFWHLADDYDSLPSLSASWIMEDKSNVDRVLAVTSAVSNQIIADFYFEQVSVRAMPVYSFPGYIDHH